MNITQVTGNEEIIHVFDQFEIIADNDGFYAADGEFKIGLPQENAYWISQVCRRAQDFICTYPNEMMQIGIDE